MVNIEVVISNPSVQHKQVAKRILADLPEWFGIPESTQQYIEAAGNQLCLLAQNAHGYIGFMSLIETAESFEIDCMGVFKCYHNQGVGLSMMSTLKEFVRQKEKSALLVKTLSEGHPSIEYAKTRTFYEKMGFMKCHYLDIWSEGLPCLEMRYQL